MPRLSSGLAGSASRSPLFEALPLAEPAETSCPRIRIAVALPSALFGPASALVQLTQVSSSGIETASPLADAFGAALGVDGEPLVAPGTLTGTAVSPSAEVACWTAPL